MQKIKFLLAGLLCLTLFTTAYSHVAPTPKNAKIKKDARVSFRADCAQAAATGVDQSINNVRARLLNGGDVWWDGNNGRYVVPKVPAGVPEVSSLFAGAVWLGGKDPAGNLKIAAQTYGTSRGQSDFWPGPLDPTTGAIEKQTCLNWDRFFKVLGTEVKEHLRNYNSAAKGEIDYTVDMIPDNVKGWPSQGNPYFLDVHGFELPNTGQGLAGYFDENRDGIYDPLDGDFPVIEIIGCTNYDLPGIEPQFPDEMVYWIYNDNGNTHSETNADAIQMEVQVQAFAYATNDFINDMTFQRYKLINRAVEDIRQCYFAMWVDPDLGCSTDDYVGCDSVRSFAYVYNQDAVDGETGCTCSGGVETYCNDVPILGVDYFRGPKAPTPVIDSITGMVLLDSLTGDTVFIDVELGMSSFTYYNRGDAGTPPPGTTDPETAQEYYNYLTGRWRDGSTFQFGGSGYNTGGRNVNYAFPNPPDCADANACWSMCTSGLGIGDRRTIQASGPFTLRPNATNELIIGAVWLPEANYPCPDISELLKADDIAQGLFDNCFDIVDGPDAPDVDWIELDQKIIGVLSNDQETSNNKFEAYSELDIASPPGLDTAQREYRFEGYKVFQLENASVTVGDLNNTEKAKLVFQCDVDNGIGEIYNWEAVPNPTVGEYAIWVPTEKVQATSLDQGISHSFEITEDRFASGDSRLVNHKKYYFLAIAYAHNNYEQFDPFYLQGQGTGQYKPYLEGRNNIIKYTVIPRPIVDQNLNANYGDGVKITRIEGVGVGSQFLDLSDETRAAIEASGLDNSVTELTYRQGMGPFEVKIYDVLGVKDGEFELKVIDADVTDGTLDAPATWEMTDVNTGEVIESEVTIDQLNEQLITNYGFSVSVKDGLEAGNNYDNGGDEANGAIPMQMEFPADNPAQWLGGITDNAIGLSVPAIAVPIFDFVRTGVNEEDEILDPENIFATSGWMMPYYLLDYRQRVNNWGGYVSPVWFKQGGLVRQQQKNLSATNNVDIVFTSDKSLWSRCVVVEGTSPAITQFGLTSENETEHFFLRSVPSVGKEDADGDGIADPDGAEDENGEAINGMSWFPGYAVDVETGKRLNIFFGEASAYRCDEPTIEALNLCGSGLLVNPTGADMMWNPTDQGFIDPGIQVIDPSIAGVWQAILGGQHFLYVTNEEYDECKAIYDYLKTENSVRIARALRSVTWAGTPILTIGSELNSYADGLIPSTVRMKLRADNPYAVSEANGVNSGYPTYRFKVEGKEATDLANQEEVDGALDQIRAVPNPYYGFSAYETSQFSTKVKITNLPAQCTVTIYSLDGKFIRQYERDEIGAINPGGNRPVARRQINPDLEWDLNNSKGIPISSGVYLIHIKSEGQGERVLKWFGVPRQFDPSGL